MAAIKNGTKLEGEGAPVEEKKRGRGRPFKTALDDRDKEIIKMKKQGLKQSQISKVLGITQKAVCNRMKYIAEHPSFVEFCDKKAEHFEMLQHRMYEKFDDDEILDAVIRKQGVLPIAILQDKIRVLRDQAVIITEFDIRALGLAVNVPAQIETADIIEIEEDK